MMKAAFLVFSLLTFSSVSSQQAFPFQQNWGTYVGPSSTSLSHQFYVDTAIFLDLNNNIYLNGHASTIMPGLINTYYDQFVFGGGNSVTSSVSANNVNYTGTFTHAGAQIFGSYTTQVLGGGRYEKNLRYIDPTGNKYYAEVYTGVINNLGTANTWLPQNPMTNSQKTIVLRKYSTTGNVIYTTYLPNNMITDVLVKGDPTGAIYVTGKVNQAIPNLGSAGTLHSDYIDYTLNGGGQGDNSYLVKLDPTGNKLWGTYSAGVINNLEFFNNKLYLIAYQPEAVPAYTTPGTFQPTVPGQFNIISLNAVNGQPVWGTYYGLPETGTFSLTEMPSIEIDETGLYVAGYTDGGANPSYFGSANAYKSTLTGGSDLFVSKFDFSGNRIWSTYFGGAGTDISFSDEPIAVYGNMLVLAGNQYENNNNLATAGAFVDTPPNQNGYTNSYFAGFNAATGAFEWCSYIGGPGSGTNSLGEHISPHFMSNGSLLLYGVTGSTAGIATPNGQFPAMVGYSSGGQYGYLMRFDRKNIIATDEVQNSIKDLQLFDNPNNGNFSLSGSILEKQNCMVTITDAAGRLVLTKKLTKSKSQHFDLANQLAPGKYLLEVTTSEGAKLKVFKMLVR